ncbi:unnamed protein product [Rotaria sp. Silwood2]|nr:unnamed protein product [Rotaria sp. Silwood2]CAF2787085.1 unnamed protein product [Rotaria sp. Silwood2]CAF3972214.1 unnamed protein product [Rotaria sp. Silwood2]CAF4154030.1 unnamed protein product [Rotaria sp. Silwood2]
MVRFSTTTYGREYPDSARNLRGIAMKFNTDEGNYDILCVNFPVFFVLDPTQGLDNFSDAEGMRMCGEDPDYAKNDLWQHLDNGETCEFKFQIQMTSEGEIHKVADFYPCDATKIWPEERYTYLEFGRVSFHQIPVNYPFRTHQYHPLARNGRLRCDANGSVESNIYPNSFTQPPRARLDLTCNEKPQSLQGYLARKSHSHHENEFSPDTEYVQAR